MSLFKFGFTANTNQQKGQSRSKHEDADESVTENIDTYKSTKNSKSQTNTDQSKRGSVTEGNMETITSKTDTYTKNNNMQMNTAKQRRKINNHSKTRWLEEFSIYFDDDKMKCKFCKEANNYNQFSTCGSINYQRSALTRHQESDDHKLSLDTLKSKREMTNAINEALDASKTKVKAMLTTVLFMVEEEIADRKFPALLNLQVSNA